MNTRAFHCNSIAITGIYALLLGLMLMLVGCKSPNDSLKDQILTFTQPGPVTLAVGNNLANAAQGQGSGLITYQSTHAAIATVNGQGVVTAISPGSTTISATIAADEQFQSARASYTVTVKSTVATTATIKAWVGVEESEITVTSSSDLTGIELYRSSDPNCDLNNYSLCTDGNMSTLTGSESSFIDTSFRLGNTGHYNFVKDNHQITQKLSTSKPRHRAHQKLIYFKNKFIAYGDLSVNFMYRPAFNWPHYGRQSIWVSDDGFNWIYTKSDKDLFSVNYSIDFQVIEFQNKLWLIRDQQVWSSEDGVNWTNAVETAEFPARNNSQLVVFKGKLWLTGGKDAAGYKNDAWSSSNGIDWTQESANTAFSPRADHHLLAYQNQLWIIGGHYSDDGYHNDVWASDDGVQWREVSENLDFLITPYHQAMVFDGKIWIFGAQEAWHSSDGIQWKKSSSQEPFLEYVRYQMTVRDNQIWRISGVYGFDEVWLSEDGTTWKNLSNNAAFSAEPSQIVAFRNRLYLFKNQETVKIWSSNDGFDWQQEASDQTHPSRKVAQIVDFNNKLWIIGGGDDYSKTWLYDIWSSHDGIQWIEEEADKPFFPRNYHQVVTFKNKLWVIGGEHEGEFFNDVWSSSDGINWVLETENAGFPPRRSFQAVEFNSRLWLVGGETTDDEFNDVWSSADGVVWTPELLKGPFMSRSGHNLAVFNNKLWLVGGYNRLPRPGDTHLSDVWSSPDGLEWTIEQQSISRHGSPKPVVNVAPFPARKPHVVAFDNKLWVFSDGTAHQPYSGIWSSQNGAVWRLGYQTEINLP